MINKRLLKEVPQALSFILRQVAAQWVSLVANILFVFILASMIQNAYNQASISVAFYVGLAICGGCIGIRMICAKRVSRYSYLAACDVKDSLRTRLFLKLGRLQGHYQDAVTTSELVQLNTEGIDQLEIYFGRYLPQLFYSMVAPITLFSLILFLDWKSALVLLLCVPLIPLSIVAVQKIAKKLLSKYWSSYTGLGDSFLENLQGLTTLKIYQADEMKAELMHDEAENFRKITMKVLTMQLNSVSVMDFIAYGGAALGTIFALSGFISGTLSLLNVLLILLLSAEFFIPMRLLGSYFHVAMNGIAASDKIFRLLDLPETTQKKEALSETMMTIDLAHVHFSYDAQRPILNDVSFTIQPGEFVGIVGESGSGKSTLAKLIHGLQLHHEDVKVNGQKRSQVLDEAIMKRIVLVSHQSTIFKGTVRQNLQLAKPSATDLDMLESLRLVCLDEFVSSQEGLNTLIKENASNLSGGQRQRLAIARALLKEAEVYIFDEATSNVDAESEEAILSPIELLAKQKKTVILITHRLSTTMHCDNIIVMQQGQKVEEGTFNQLKQKQGVFAKMFGQQNQLEQWVKGEIA